MKVKERDPSCRQRALAAGKGIVVQATQVNQESIDRFEQLLLRAAEVVGDLTRPSIELFYSRFPEAREAFEQHGLGHRERLEAEMVDTALYCVMTWLERPMEVEIMLYGSVPHHKNTLQVRPDWYRGLLGSVIDVVEATVPRDAPEDRALVEKIRSGLLAAIHEALE